MWVNDGHVKRKKVLSDTEVKTRKDDFLNGFSTGLKNPTRKGKRLIVSHIGNEDK